MSKNSSNTLLTVPEVARLLRKDGSTVRRWIADGDLDAIALPQGRNPNRKSWLVARRVLATFMKIDEDELLSLLQS